MISARGFTRGCRIYPGGSKRNIADFALFWQLRRYHRPDAPGCRKHREPSLTDFCDGIMYSKIKQENWATLLKITPQKMPKIKSVAQFNKRIRFRMQRTEPAPHSSSRRNTTKKSNCLVKRYAGKVQRPSRFDKSKKLCIIVNEQKICRGLLPTTSLQLNHNL